jgi:hypothetical protein
MFKLCAERPPFQMDMRKTKSINHGYKDFVCLNFAKNCLLVDECAQNQIQNN